MKKIAITVLGLMAFMTVYAQQATIRGKIHDEETGETLIGATVMIDGTSNGTVTDFDGNYNLQVEPGTYALKISYISYETKVISDVEAAGGKVEVVNANLGEATNELTEIVVTAKANRRSEAAMMTMKKKSGRVMDGISAEQIAKLGDSDAAGALKRVTGVSVQGGKYVFVRGLGDRYTKTTLNSAQIPGLDPEKNSVQMDLFPSNIIENITVSKTFTPDMPGDATGGHVNIVTRDFPEVFSLQFSNTFSYNTQASLQDDFVSIETGPTDWLGLDMGYRDVPDKVQSFIDGMEKDVITTVYHGDAQLRELTQAFREDVAPVTKTSFLDHSHKLSIGNQFTLKNDRALGINASLSYSRNFSYFDDGRYGQYQFATLDATKSVNDRKGEENIKVSALLNLNYKLNHNHKIGLRLLRNQGGLKIGRLRDGQFGYESAETYIQERIMGYQERNFLSGQLHGKHIFPLAAGKNIELTWLSSYTYMAQNEPDARFFTNLYEDPDDDGELSDAVYRFKTNVAPTRIFKELDEYDLDNKINLVVPFGNVKAKIGGGYLTKTRDGQQEIFTLQNIGGTFTGNRNLDGNIASYVNSNIIDPDSDADLYYQTDLENNNLNSYEASATIISGYGMLDFPLGAKFRVLAGVRYEYTDISANNKSLNIVDIKEGGFEENDILPSLNITYTPTNNMNIRVAASQTLARPVFREIAPTSFYDYKMGMRLNGNADLERAVIQNLDLRWEYYFNRGEMVAVSGFYKSFQDPIEIELDSASQNYSVKYVNTDESYLYGMEIEARKSLGFIPQLQNFTVGGNLTLVQSVVNLSQFEQEQKGMETRPMLGQAPYVANTFLSYANRNNGWSANVAFNISGKKLLLLTRYDTPYICEQPRPSLNMNIGKAIGDHFNVEVSADNILNSEYKAHHQGAPGSVYMQYSQGRTFGLSIKYKL